MKQFDLISDLHIDHWLKNQGSQEKNAKFLHQFVDSLLPNEISEVLVIAGDFGHKNSQNYEFLLSLKSYYKYIIVVAGNHDYYLLSSKDNKFKYNRNSLNRWKEMKKLGQSIDNVYYLDGEIVTINGITFGGTGMWYDFSYGIQHLEKSLSEMFDVWHNGMNDEKYIYGLPRKPQKWFFNEKQNLEKIIYDCDVIITHMGPDWSKIPLEYELDPLSACYFFDGSKYFEYNKLAGKIWAFGHTHLHYNYTKNGCWLVNNALGYPDEKNVGTKKIVNIPL